MSTDKAGPGDAAALPRQAMAPLEFEAGRFQRIIDAAPSGMVIVDRHGRIRFANAELERIFEYSRSEILGRPVEVLLPDALRSVHEDLRSRFVADPRSRRMGDGRDLWARRKSGQAFPIEVGLAVVDHGEDTLILATVVDITMRKKAEEAQRLAQKMEALGRLAGGVAHDFNNVLAAITGNLRLAMADVRADHAAWRALVEADAAAERAVALVRQILGFSRVEEARSQAIDPRPAVDDALRLLRATLPAMVQLRPALAARVPPVEIDPTHVHQILMNLVTNGAHAIGERAGRIDVQLDDVEVTREMTALLPDLAPGRYVRLMVSDDGAGMDAATRERIFDPFFTTKPAGQGTGLGLSVVHGIVKGRGGAINVYSVVGKGTTFSIYLPAVARATATADPARREAPQGGGERILYVDDEEALVFLARRVLDRLGYRVAGFTEADAALRVFEAEPDAFDAVVTDLSMPGMSGFEVARAVRARRPDIPLVVATGFVRAEDEERARALDVSAMVLKPNSVNELAVVLDRLLAAQRVRRPASG